MSPKRATLTGMAGIEKRTNKHSQTWRVYWREEGQKQQETFHTLEAAQEFRALVEAHGNRWPYGWTPRYGYDSPTPGMPTFKQWASTVIESRPTTSERTRNTYRAELRNHLNPEFGHIYIDKITRQHVGEWLIRMQKGPLSAKSVRNIRDLAASIMHNAVKEGLIRLNPFVGMAIALPASRTETMQLLTRGEVENIARHLDPLWQPIPMLLAETGLRWSEFTALSPQHLNLQEGLLTVVRAWKQTPDGWRLGEPKTVKSRRTIALSKLSIRLFAEMGGGEYIASSVTGGPLRHANFYENGWLPAVAHASVCREHLMEQERPAGRKKRWRPAPCACPGVLAKRPRIHDLRHTHASWLLGAGVPIFTVSRRMGHANFATTSDRYGHLDPNLDRDAVAALDRM